MKQQHLVGNCVCLTADWEGEHGRNRTVPLMLFGFQEPDRNLSFSLPIRAEGGALAAC